jgi:ABC-type phosphate transport system permease subunit
MPSEAEPVPFERRFRHGLRTHRAVISVFVLAVGVLLTVLAAGAFTPLQNSFPFTAINSATNPAAGPNYNLVFIIVGPIIVIVGAYLVGAYFSARHRFEHLMLTKSKAEFLRNIPELEKLLWDLTPEDEVRYDRKRAELRLRH